MSPARTRVGGLQVDREIDRRKPTITCLLVQGAILSEEMFDYNRFSECPNNAKWTRSMCHDTADLMVVGGAFHDDYNYY